MTCVQCFARQRERDGRPDDWAQWEKKLREGWAIGRIDRSKRRMKKDWAGQFNGGHSSFEGLI